MTKIVLIPFILFHCLSILSKLCGNFCHRSQKIYFVPLSLVSYKKALKVSVPEPESLNQSHDTTSFLEKIL